MPLGSSHRSKYRALIPANIFTVSQKNFPEKLTCTVGGARKDKIQFIKKHGLWSSPLFPVCTRAKARARDPAFPVGWSWIIMEDLLSNSDGHVSNIGDLLFNIEKKYSTFMDSLTGMSNIFIFFVPGWFNIPDTMSNIFCQTFKQRSFLSKILGKTFNIPFAFRDGSSNISTGSFNI
jgi:hypothetical protein